MKKSMTGFEKMFEENRERLELFCNVDANKDVNFEELCSTYDAVVLAYGANKPRKLGLENEYGNNCFSGGEFVSWYNGMSQQYIKNIPKLDTGSNAIVIGNGNVAIDCSRILLSSPERLKQTDITENALNALRKSKIKNVYIIGRRGPKEISFTIKELRELLNLEGVNSHCLIDSNLKEKLEKELNLMERPRRRIVELMLNFAEEKKSSPTQKSLKLLFNSRPTKIELSNKNDSINALYIQNNLDNLIEKIECSLLIVAIGFENILLNGLPKNENGQLKMIDWCRVPKENSLVYATGWCSHAARGLIADSQQQAYSVADQIYEDLNKINSTKNSIQKMSARTQIEQKLCSRGVEFINWDDWKYIDECERRMGAILGKTREKMSEISSILRIMRNKGIKD
uniref:FAD/NAD(P)-binding domain-containing protein n=1 Tax=Meloidogyne incognita TaxID=6306 RepID=A0A914LEY8_MELIC